MTDSDSDRDLVFTPVVELRRLIASGELSPVELTEAVLRRIGSLNPAVNSFLTVCEESALRTAREAETALSRGESWGPLHGVPVGIKDLYETEAVRTTYGSLLYKDHISEADGILASRLKAAGAILVGKTNTPEFGSAFSTENLLGEPCRNPWNLEMSSGGSSGGAAAGVAAGMCPVCPGSDGGGSIRVPASLCGLFGLKPTYGRIPYDVHPVHGAGLDFICHGPITRTVKDAAFLLATVGGADPRDYAALQTPLPDYVRALEEPSGPLRIAWSADLGYASPDDEAVTTIEQTLEVVEDLGHNVEVASLQFDPPFGTWEELASAANHVVFAGMLEKHGDQLTPYFRRSLEIGAELDGDDIISGWMDVVRWRGRLSQLLADYDLLITPTVAQSSFPVDVAAPERPLGHGMMYWQVAPFTAIFNFTQNPAATVPCGIASSGLPIGMQIVGRLRDEVTVLKLAAEIEEARPWVHRRPAIC